MNSIVFIFIVLLFLSAFFSGSEIAFLNLKKQYFNEDVYTDVISFNLEEPGDPIDGEIYISLPRIIDNANQYDSNLNDEFKRIIIHGLLHLVGYNDLTNSDKKQMTSLEDKYIKLSKGEIISH